VHSKQLTFAFRCAHETRLSQNTPQGYYILSDDVNAIDNGLYGTIDFDQVCQVVGLTDGFSQIYDTFNIFDIPTFLNQLKTQSIEQLYNILWQAQEDDCFCNNHPRYKIRDDATIFVFNA
jgi:hypothetical protein